MRARLLRAILLVAVAAVVAVALPLGVVGSRLVREQNRDALQEQANGIAQALLLADRTGTFPDDLLQMPPGHYLEIRRGPSALVVGEPPDPAVVVTATNARGDRILVAAPGSVLDEGVGRLWLVVGGLAGVVLALAAGVGTITARRLSEPMRELAAASARLGEGDFDVRTGRWAVPEIDAVAEALDRSASLIDGMVRSEREFSSNASHQLRTALTGLRLRLEELTLLDDPAEMREEAGRALASADRLEQTLTSLLALARRGRTGEPAPVDLRPVLTDGRDRWGPVLDAAGRALRVDVPDAPVVGVADAAALGQVLDVLVDNAHRHGAGPVTIEVHPREGAWAIAVTDAGAGIPAHATGRIFERGVSLDSGSGLGLALARELAERTGARLVLRSPAPPRFEVVVPATVAATPP